MKLFFKDRSHLRWKLDRIDDTFEVTISGSARSPFAINSQGLKKGIVSPGLVVRPEHPGCWKCSGKGSGTADPSPESGGGGLCGDSLGGSGAAAASAQPAFSWTCGREGRSADVTFALVTSGIESSTETPYGPGPRGPWMGLSRSWLRGTQRHSMSREGWGSLVTLSTAEPSCAGSSW